MTLVVGLGNVGREYELTRHNAGFMLVDLLLQDLPHSDISKPSFKGSLYKSELGLFLKPSTFMNSSGESVLAVRNYFKCDRLIVIHDDIDLNLGVLRFKMGGGNGGHNGLGNIQQLIGQQYARLRMGIGNEFQRGGQVDWVLGKYTADDMAILQPSIVQAVDIIKSFVLAGINITMNQYNKLGKKNK